MCGGLDESDATRVVIRCYAVLRHHDRHMARQLPHCAHTNTRGWRAGLSPPVRVASTPAAGGRVPSGPTMLRVGLHSYEVIRRSRLEVSLFCREGDVAQHLVGAIL